MSGSRSPRIELASVSRAFPHGAGGPVRALEKVSVTIDPAEFVSVEGPSGCGKTTLLNLLGLLDIPSSGTIQWDGVEVGRWKERDRARRRLTSIGFIFQRFYLLPTLTARENVALPMQALGVSAVDRRGRADALLARVGLSDRAEFFPHQLSGGEEQRVAIARALANVPGILLADEPTGELDSANTAAILTLIDELHRERATSVVVVTHNPTVAAYAHRHLTMADGRIVADRRDA
ncbi:MAG: ABC transporter ATP-binding protein [Thermoplasmata archaeon]|nr:ABC transporter ATP-binding protein [Thermoplasmata archaeon]